LHAPVRGQLEILQDALILADADGTITAVHRQESADHAPAAAQFAAAGQLVTIGAGKYRRWTCRLRTGCRKPLFRLKHATPT
jgi:hypothetical protein